MTAEELKKLSLQLRPRLINFAKGFVKDGASTPEDMVQEAIIKLWMSSQVQQVRNPEAMTTHILRNVCLDYLKLKKNNTDGLNSNMRVFDSQDPADILESKDEMCRIQRHLDSLPREQMLAVRLRDVMGYEMSEIAVILDTSEGNVRTLLSRERQKLKEKLLSKWKQ